MRVSVVPAQITTIEDKIAGNISVQQAVLLLVPVLFGFVAAIILPPSGQFVAYKIAIAAVIFVICGVLALRIRDRIIAQWIVLFAVYIARPKYYVYDKNTSYLRANETTKVIQEDKVADVQPGTIVKPRISKIAPHEFARLEQFAIDRRADIKFIVGKKGELNVHVTEVK